MCTCALVYIAVLLDDLTNVCELSKGTIQLFILPNFYNYRNLLHRWRGVVDMMTVHMVLSRNCIVIVNILYLYRLERARAQIGHIYGLDEISHV